MKLTRVPMHPWLDTVSAGPAPVQLEPEAEPEQMPSSTELDVRISCHCLHQDVMHNIFWQLMSCQLGIPEG